MSTLKSSAEDLTLNADGSGNDVIIQSDGSTKAIITAEGNIGIGDTDPSEAKLSIDNVASGDKGLQIVQAQDEYGLFIDQNGNNYGLYIDSEATSVYSMFVSADAVTTGSAGYFYSNSADTSTRNLVKINNDHASSTGTTALMVDQDSTGLAADFNGGSGIRTSAGILFGTDTAAANTLDDYEEGTWTPSILVGSGLSIGTVHQNRYTKIGRTVTLNASFNIDSTSSPASGAVRIGGFPFTVSSFSNGGFPIDIHYNYKVTPCAFINAAGYM